MTSAFNLHAVAQFSAERMLNCIVEGMAIALFAWLLLRVIGLLNSGRQNSGTRFAVWFAALFAIAALPFVGALAPSGATGAASASHPAITAPTSWAFYLFFVWVSIAVLGLLRVGIGLWHVRRVRKNCTEIDIASLDPALRMTLKEFRSIRSVKICVSDGLQVPTAIGFVKPVVALPAWTIRELSVVELNTILLHELAHLRRWDDWSNLAQKLLRAVFFFHPAVWWIESKLSLEREMACDDAVLASTANPRAYAECLVTVAEKSFMRGLAMAQAAVSRVRQTSQRVAQILDTSRPGATRIWMPALGMVAAFAVVCGGLLSHSPELVSFQDKAQVRATPSESRSASIAAINPVAHLRLVAGEPVKLVASKHENNAASRSYVARTVLAKTTTPQREAETIAAVVPKQERPRADAALIPAKFTPTNGAGGNETGTNEISTKQQPRLKSVVLVYQGLQYDDAGFAHWTICVWHLTVRAQQKTVTTNPAKST